MLHDPAREFDYATGAEQALEQAHTNGWTVVSVKDDWTDPRWEVPGFIPSG